MTITQSDWIGLAGIFVSLLGFALALYQIRTAKTAAESARDSAKLATEGVRRLDSLISFTSVSKSIEEIKAACRKDDFSRLPNLFDDARKALISARESHPGLTVVDLGKIQKTLTFFKAMEIEVAKADGDSLAGQKVKFTKSLIDISDDVSSLVSRARHYGD